MITGNIKIPNLQPTAFIKPDGNLHPEILGFLSQLITVLQNNFKAEGYSLPQQNPSNILLLNTLRSVGNIIYNSTSHKAMINENGTYKTITTS